MSVQIEQTIVLTGTHAGKTIKLGKLPYNFVKGKMVLRGSAEDVALHAKFIERNWQGYPEGHPNLEETSHGNGELSQSAQRDEDESVQGPVQQAGTGGQEPSDDGQAADENAAGQVEPVSTGDGQQSAPVNEKLVKAIRKLDPTNDSHWTKEGKPAIEAVAKLYGANDVTRADVEAAAPGHNRKAAQQA